MRKIISDFALETLETLNFTKILLPLHLEIIDECKLVLSFHMLSAWVKLPK